MIKFFRKIRYNLMEQNKTGKYLKYAIGEIALVVIGILIALQINNWNEGRKATNKLHTYTQKLINDIVSDTINLNTLIDEGKKMQNTIEVYFEYFDSGNKTLDELLDSAYLDFDLSNSNFHEITSWNQNDNSKRQGLLHFHNVLTNYHNLVSWTENFGIDIREKSKKCLELLTKKEDFNSNNITKG